MKYIEMDIFGLPATVYFYDDLSEHPWPVIDKIVTKCEQTDIYPHLKPEVIEQLEWNIAKILRRSA